MEPRLTRKQRRAARLWAHGPKAVAIHRENIGALRLRLEPYGVEDVKSSTLGTRANSWTLREESIWHSTSRQKSAARISRAKLAETLANVDALHGPVQMAFWFRARGSLTT